MSKLFDMEIINSNFLWYMIGWLAVMVYSALLNLSPGDWFYSLGVVGGMILFLYSLYGFMREQKEEMDIELFVALFIWFLGLGFVYYLLVNSQINICIEAWDKTLFLSSESFALFGELMLSYSIAIAVLIAATWMNFMLSYRDPSR